MAVVAGSSVSSVFARTGAVTAADGDYYGAVAQAKTGATAASRYVGATNSGAPAAGTFAVGDYIVARDGAMWVCTVAGTPGTWVEVGAAGNLVTSVFGRTGAVAAAANDYTFAQIAAAANSVAVSNLVAGTAGQVLGGTGPSYALPPGYEVGYDQITATVNVTSTTEATGTTIIAGSAHTFDGSPVIAEFYTPVLVLPQATSVLDSVVVSIFEGATQIARIVQAYFADLASAQQLQVGQLGRYRFTPSAGSHTYSVTAYTNSTTGTPAVTAGAGGTAVHPPAYLRFTKA